MKHIPLSSTGIQLDMVPAYGSRKIKNPGSITRLHEERGCPGAACVVYAFKNNKARTVKPCMI
jgi:hypothetical protein